METWVSASRLFPRILCLDALGEMPRGGVPQLGCDREGHTGTRPPSPVAREVRPYVGSGTRKRTPYVGSPCVENGVFV
ncbi:MAG: hypothetical protein RIQ79_370 [Verrucomicrobiota bacterium]